MRFVEVKYNQPAGNATKMFVFTDNAKGELWARNLPKIRDSLPFSRTPADSSFLLEILAKLDPC